MAETKAEFNLALNSVARWLAIRDHSRYELKQKLARRFEDALCENVLKEAQTRGWLANDDVIAERFAAALSRRGKSHGYITAQLKKRRLPLIPADGDSELQKAQDLLRKKFGHKNFGDEKLSYNDKAKAFRFLKYRGFADCWIRKALE